MPLELKRYDVAIARDGLELDKALEAGEGSGYDVHRVVVLHADQLVAEQAAPRYGIPPLGEDNPQKMTWATLWIWCALRRMTVEVPPFPAFKGRVLNMEQPKPTDQPLADPTDTTDPDQLAVDPTVPGLDTGSP